jgi:signal transduction histidine kinase
MKRSHETLKRSLTRQYVLLACVPLLMVVVLWSVVAIPQAVHDIEDDNRRIALLVRAQVELLIDGPRDAVARAAARLGADASDDAVGAALAAVLEQAPSLDTALALDDRGLVTRAAVRPGSGTTPRAWLGLDLSRRAFYPQARAATAPVWSDTFLSPLTGRVTAVVTAPAGGRLVMAELALDRIAHQIHVPGSPGEVAVVVFDGLGRVIVHPQQQLVSWQENLSGQPLVRQALEGRAGRGEIALDGKHWLATVAPAATTGWYVLVAQPRSAMFAPVAQLAGVVGVAVLLVLAVVIATALRLAERQAARYRQLLDAATALVDEAPDPPEVELGSEEVQGLWVQLRRLLDRSKEQERAARHAQAELQALLDAATEVAIIAVDAGHVVRLFNRGAEKMLGHRAAEVVGGPCPATLFDAGELARRAAALSRQLQQPVQGLQAVTAVAERFGYEVRDWTWTRGDGTRLSVSLAVTAVRVSAAEAAPQARAPAQRGDAPAGFLFVAIDQSERVRAGELELARRRAEAASQAKSEFLSRVSHELRTPMNAMLGYAQLLQLEGDAHRLDDHQRERVARIEQAGWHLVDLINDVLDLSTIESGNARIQMAEIDVGPVIEDGLRLVAPLAGKAGVTLAAALPPEAGPASPRPWRVHADATRLRQVLVNVIGNAIKYNVAGGRVDIHLRTAVAPAAPAGEAGEVVGTPRASPGDSTEHAGIPPGSELVEIEVVDTGRGMTPAQLARLFSAFDRLGLESSAIEGTGIGLVISRRLLERMGGAIAVDSRAGVGTRVTLSLRRAGIAGAEAAFPASAPAAPAHGAGGQIVYVEDNPINALLMQEVVAQRPGCRLHLAVGVADGIAMIDRLRPDLVLVDLHLPDGSGLDVARWMQATPGLQRVPVVAVSADSTQAQRDAATAAGVRAYLAKPVHLADALQLIDALLPGR